MVRLTVTRPSVPKTVGQFFQFVRPLFRQIRQASGHQHRLHRTAAGFEPERISTHAFDRQAPLDEVTASLLQSYLDEVMERASPHLAQALLAELGELVAPNSPKSFLRQAHLSMTWLNVLAFGRKPGT